MSLKIRVIPTILYNSHMMVTKPKTYERPGRSVGPLMQLIKTMNTRNIDELILIDIDASREFRTLPFEKIEEFTSELFCPVTLGGGIKSLFDIEQALKAGADKVSINNALVDKEFIKQACQKFGSQAIVAAVDVILHAKTVQSDASEYRPTIHCGMQYINKSLETFVEELEELGVGEILLTAVYRDGTRAGYDKSLIKKVAQKVRIPVIASGGCAGFNDMIDALKAGADAVAAGSMFLFSGLTPKNCSFYLDNHGFPTRLDA